MAERNQLGDLKIKLLPGVMPSLSNDAEFLPGMPKSWAYTFLINDEDAPPDAGQQPRLGGAGQPLLLDRPPQQHRWLLGSPDLPVCDGASVGGYLEMETAVYDALNC